MKGQEKVKEREGKKVSGRKGGRKRNKENETERERKKEKVERERERTMARMLIERKI